MLKQLATLLVLLLSTVVVQAQVYKWTDEHGKTHYTSQPPSDQKIKSSILTNQNNTVSEETLCQRACSNIYSVSKNMESELVKVLNHPITDFSTKREISIALDKLRKNNKEMMTRANNDLTQIKQGCLNDCPRQYKEDPNTVKCMASAYNGQTFAACMRRLTQ